MGFFNTDSLIGKGRAEIDFLTAQTDAAATGDHDGFVVKGIVDVRQPCVAAGRGLIDLGWALHVESLVRAFVVEDVRKFFEARLLLQEVGSSGFGGFFFQGEMHAFMTAVLLRMAGLNPFNANAEAQPPHGELAQIKQSVSGSEGHAVVAADAGGQAALAKKPFKHDKSVIFPGGGKSFTGEEKTAGVVGDGERVAVFAISQQELAFVIGAPQLVGALP